MRRKNKINSRRLLLIKDDYGNLNKRIKGINKRRGVLCTVFFAFGVYWKY